MIHLTTVSVFYIGISIHPSLTRVRYRQQRRRALLSFHFTNSVVLRLIPGIWPPSFSSSLSIRYDCHATDPSSWAYCTIHCRRSEQDHHAGWRSTRYLRRTGWCPGRAQWPFGFCIHYLNEFAWNGLVCAVALTFWQFIRCCVTKKAPKSGWRGTSNQVDKVAIENQSKINWTEERIESEPKRLGLCSAFKGFSLWFRGYFIIVLQISGDVVRKVSSDLIWAIGGRKVNHYPQISFRWCQIQKEPLSALRSRPEVWPGEGEEEEKNGRRCSQRVLELGHHPIFCVVLK